MKQNANHSNVQCVMCKRSEAAHICICINPPTPLCFTCTEKHINRMCLEEHTFMSVKAFPYFNGPECLSTLKGRQVGAREGKQKLMKILEQMTAAEKQTMDHFERLIEEIRRLQQDKLQELRKLREQLKALVDSAVTEVGDHIYESDYESENWLSTALWNYSTHPVEFNLFTFTCDGAAALHSIRHSVFAQIDVTGREDKNNLVLYHPKQDQLNRWDSRLKSHVTPVPLSVSIIVDSRSAWICTGDRFVFVCGGCDPLSATAYLINAKDGAVENFPPMKQARGAHGLIVYGREACVFGGLAAKRLKSAEMFNLREKLWVQLPDLSEPRSYCTPCRLEDKVFLAGGYGASQIECFNWTARTFTQIKLKISEDPSICVVHDGRLIILQPLKIYSWKLDSNELERLPTIIIGYGCAKCPVVVSQGCVYVENTKYHVVVEMKVPELDVRGIYSFSS